MKINIRSTLVHFLFIISIMLFVLLTVFMGKKEKTFWNGYYVVLVQKDIPLDKAIEDLKTGIKPKSIVSGETALVAFTRFSGMETSKINNIEQRLDPDDPRIDPYIMNVNRYFTANRGWNTIFIASDLSPLWFYLKIIKLCREKGYMILLPGSDLPGKIIFLIFFLSFLILFINTLKRVKGKLFIIISTFPWLYWSFLAGDLYDSLAFFIIFPFWVQLIIEINKYFVDLLIYRWKNREILLQKAILYTSACLIVLIFSCIKKSADFPFMPVLINWILAAGYYSFSLFINLKYAHKLFRYIPFPVHPGIKQLLNLKTKNIVFILVMILVITLIPIYYFARSKLEIADLYIPVPVYNYLDRKPGTEILTDMNNYNRKKLPGLADFLAHLRYQERIYFGAGYRTGEGAIDINIDSYQITPGNRIAQSTQPLTLGKEWADRIFSTLTENSLEKMLFRQGKFQQFELISINLFYQNKYLYWVYSLLLLLIPLFLHLTSFALLNNIKTIFRKRKLFTA